MRGIADIPIANAGLDLQHILQRNMRPGNSLAWRYSISIRIRAAVKIAERAQVGEFPVRLPPFPYFPPVSR